MSLLEIHNLKKHFPVGDGFFSRNKGSVKAVDGVNLTVHEGETLGIVGESGCGKSTLGRTAVQLTPATSGSVKFRGRELVGLTRKQLRPVRRDVQIVFQDPYASLNPRLPVAEILDEPL